MSKSLSKPTTRRPGNRGSATAATLAALCWLAPSTAILASSPPALGNAPGSSAPKTAWVETYAAEDDRWYRHQDLVFCDGAMTLGLLEEHHDPDVPPSVSLWLYRVDGDGTLLDTFGIPKPAAEAPGRPANVDLPENLKVECSPDGGTVIAFNFPEGWPWWVRLDSEGQVLGSRRIGGSDLRLRPAGLLREPGGTYLVLGFGPEAATAVRVDADGVERSRIVRDHGKNDAFVGGCPRDGGGVILVANSLGDTTDPRPQVWLSAYGDDGELEKELRLPGRFGTVARWSEEGGTLVYDRSTGERQSIWAVTLDADFETVREVEISDQGGTLTLPYATAAAGEGAVFVLGNRWDHAQLTKLDTGGQRLWSVFGRDWGRSLDFHLGLDESGDAYVLLSRFVSGNSGFRRKITLAKVAE